MTTAKRARDSDRDDVVAALSDTFVDGQITAAEREERTAAALAATHTDELLALVADLRGDSVDAVVARLTPPRTAPRPAPPRTPAVLPKNPARSVVVFLAFVGILVAAPFGVHRVLSGFGDEPGDVPSEVLQEQRADVVDLADANLEAAHPAGTGFATQEFEQLEDWTLSEDRVTDLVGAWTAFTGPYLTELSLRSSYVSLTVPTRSAGDVTLERWSYGYAHAPTTASMSHADLARDTVPGFSVAELDVPLLFDNVERALSELGVEEAVVSTIGVQTSIMSGLPEVSIYVRNRLEDTARLTTTLAGHVLAEYPFYPDR